MKGNPWVGGSIGRRGFPMLGTGKRGLSTYIKDIFKNGEQGFFYDPSDLKTQYQDAAGTAAVSATGQPLGLVLDKSKGLALGVNIQSNGTGDSISGWNTFGAGLSLQNGTFRMNGVGSGTVVAAPNLPLVSGRLYAVSMSIKADVPTNTVSLNFRKKSEPSISISKQNPAMSLDTTYKTITVFLSTDVPTADTALCFRFSGTEVINVDWIEVHELAGNHAYQTTSAARPLFRQKPILGNELLVNGSFSTGLTGWTNPDSGGGVTSASGDTVKLNANGGVARLRQSVNITSAGTYLVEVDVVDVTGGSTQFGIGNTTTGDVTYGFFSMAEKKRYSLIIQNVAVGLLGIAVITIPNTAYIEIENISLKELKGYRTDQNYIEYDGVDDKLITNLPAQLTNCTVLRAIPNVGTQVKYNQTLPMLYEDSSNHSGLVAIDRALTRKEQLRLMEELDKRAGAVGFDTTLFKAFDNNQAGFVFDPNDLSTMYQDVGGTVPVTAVGQPVGLIKDKSGRNNHAFQTTSASRPILQRNATTGAYYLAFDGSDDFLVTNNIDFTTTDKLVLFAGVRKLTDSTPSAIFDFGVGGVSSTPNSFSLGCGGGAGSESYTFGSRGNGGSSYAIVPKSIQPSFNAPHSATIVTKSSILSNLSSLRVNNAILRSNSVEQGGGNYGNHPLYIGRRGGTSLPFNGHIYGLIGIGKLTSDSETAAIEKELAKRTGVTLNV